MLGYLTEPEYGIAITFPAPVLYFYWYNVLKIYGKT